MSLILVDCDGVLYDMLGAIERWMISVAGSSFQGWAETVTEYDFLPFVPESLRRALVVELDTGQIWYWVPPYSGAAEAMRTIRTMSTDRISSANRIVILTSPWPHPMIHQWRADALFRDFGIDRRSVIFCPTRLKHLVHGDILIEDNPETCREWRESNPEGAAYLIARPYNDGPITSAYDRMTWPEVAKRILG